MCGSCTMVAAVTGAPLDARTSGRKQRSRERLARRRHQRHREENSTEVVTSFPLGGTVMWWHRVCCTQMAGNDTTGPLSEPDGAGKTTRGLAAAGLAAAAVELRGRRHNNSTLSCLHPDTQTDRQTDRWYRQQALTRQPYELQKSCDPYPSGNQVARHQTVRWSDSQMDGWSGGQAHILTVFEGTALKSF